MGPLSADRGNDRFKPPPARVLVASMGPLSADRGNLGHWLEENVPGGLQWGRYQLIAEISASFLDAWPKTQSFNGAAIS